MMNLRFSSFRCSSAFDGLFLYVLVVCVLEGERDRQVKTELMLGQQSNESVKYFFSLD